MTFGVRSLRRISAALVIALAAMLSFGLTTGVRAEVYADDPSSQDPSRAQIMAMAADLAPIAKTFGCEFAWGQVIGPHSLTLEFVPKGKDVRKWEQLVTFTTFELPPEEEGQRALIERIRSLTINNFSERGTVTNKRLGADRSKMPTAYFEYELGEGAAKEFGVAGIYKARPTLALIVQYQMRKPLAQTDTAKMSALAMPTPKS
ncbi:MAG: hypothetical protein GC190_01880 [Alphaproteobacteria bacterium]|nr:hypothetical protein [Alphaproteobacteria bacterium]